MYVITEDRNSLPIIADINKLFLHKTGYSKDEVVGQPLDNLYALNRDINQVKAVINLQQTAV